MSTVTRSHQYIRLRWGIIGGLALAVILVAYSIIRYPANLNQGADSAIYLLLFLILISGYAAMAIRGTRSTMHVSQVVLQLGTSFGLLVGALWVLEVLIGNVGFPNISVGHILYFGAILAVPVTTGIASFLGARRSGNMRTGTQIGLWSGIISGLITFLTLMLVFYIFTFLNVLQHDPQNIQQFTHSGASDIVTYLAGDFLVAGTNHLWIGPVLGIICGTIGGLLGKGFITDNGVIKQQEI